MSKPPALFDPESEHALLAAALTDPANFAMPDVAPADFHDVLLGEIWRTGHDLMSAGVYADSIVLRNELARRGVTVSAAQLAHYENTPGTICTNAPAYAERVKDLARRRAAEATLRRAAKILYSSNGTWGNELAALTAQLVQAAAPRAHSQLLPANQVAALPPVTWLVKGELPQLGLSLLFGPTGGGKTFLALDYALRIAQQKPVVYVAAEGAAGYAARLLAWTHHHKQSAGQLFFVCEAVNLLNGGEVAAFIAAISPKAPALVIFDTLARCMIGGEENGSRDMGLAVAACDKIKNAIGGAALLVHHPTKAGTTERGSGALKAACDQVIRLDNIDGLLTVTCEKSKDATPFEARSLRLLPVETGRQTEDGKPETSCVVIQADKVIMRGTITKTGRTILEALALETFKDTGGRASVLIEMSKLSSTSFYRAASALLRDGYVRQHEKGDPYYLTAEGEKQLSLLPKHSHESNGSW